MSPASPYFSKYGKDFQEKIFQSLLLDTTWAAQMIEVMTPEYFDLKYLAFLADRYFAFYYKYKNFPTMKLLVPLIKEELIEGDDIILRGQIVEFLQRIKTNPNAGDLGYVKDKTLDFCKKQALKEALEESVKLIAAEQYDAVVNVMKDAISKGEAPSVGHIFFEDYDARFTQINRMPCPTGIEHLDKQGILNGGLGKGEIGVIVANTGVGKSHFLVHLGVEALTRGKNVLHYTFELSETVVGIRYDSNLCDINSSEVQAMKDKVIKHYKDNANDYGKLIIKSYPVGVATCQTLRTHIDKLLMKNFVPNVIIIDYADNMRSTRMFDSLRHEYKMIYEELRNVAAEINVPIWTASQANRESSNADIVGLNNMAEAYGKAMVSDVVLSVSRKPLEKSTGLGRLFIAKNRAGKDGIVFPIRMDCARSKIKVVDDEDTMTLTEAVKSHNTQLKDLLKSKWNEIREN